MATPFDYKVISGSCGVTTLQQFPLALKKKSNNCLLVQIAPNTEYNLGVTTGNDPEQKAFGTFLNPV